MDEFGQAKDDLGREPAIVIKVNMGTCSHWRGSPAAGRLFHPLAMGKVHALLLSMAV